VGCGQRLQAVSDHAVLSFQNVVVMIVGVTVVHVTLLVLGMVAGRRLRMAREDAIAVAFAGSQKTLMVGAFLALSVGPLAILPMVTYHAVQLFVDTLIADWLRGQPAAATNR